MYARVVSVRIAPDRTEEATTIYREQIVRSLLETKGFRATVLLTDQATGAGTTISVWESREAARANEESGALRQNIGRLQHLMQSEPVVEGYEVGVFTPSDADPAPRAMRLLRVQVVPSRADEATAIYRDSILPAAREQHGFRGALLGIDPATGAGVSATAWDSRADLDAGEASGYLREQLAKVAPLFTAEPRREVFDIALRVIR